MKKIALCLASFALAFLPVAADGAPKHQDHAPVTSRAIDWD